MEAGLQPQAARLIAKYGEDLASTGRLPLVEEWLGQLPARTIHENARLSLLRGEFLGIAGYWAQAFTDLSRARHFFSRKGDRRMEAVACSKLSTVYNNLGDTDESAHLALEGLELAPPDAFATRIRLRGNLAVTSTYFESFENAIHECKRVALESAERGYEQFAAIAHHNLGVLLRDTGRLDESLANLTRASRYWDASPSNPFADNSELVTTLLALGRDAEAGAIAESAVARTEPWEKTNGEARLGVAAVRAYQGRFDEAVEILRALADRPDVLGPVIERVLGLLVECLYLSGGTADELRAIGNRLMDANADPRLAPITAIARCLIAHRARTCSTECEHARTVLNKWRSIGAPFAAEAAELPLAVLTIDHDTKKGLQEVGKVISRRGNANGNARWWLRRVAPHIARAVEILGGGHLLVAALRSDSAFWMEHAVSAVALVDGAERRELLSAIDAHADARTADYLRGTDGADTQELRRSLIHRYAPRIYVRSFGSLTIHRGSWKGAQIVVGRRRIRLLLGLLVANFDGGLMRDQVVDLLWPEADPSSAVNSLNQTVFQLRRLLEPDYREGESPQYLISNVDTVQLNPELVSTDLAAIRDLNAALGEPSEAAAREEKVARMVDLVRGEFLADLRYEEWASKWQLGVHAEVRTALLPIARGDMVGGRQETAFRAATALMALDPYDEDAHVAMICHLSESGRRGQAREVARAFASRLRADLEEEPSEELLVAAKLAGTAIRSTRS
jgi:DNA-binding SARP family transcriptional activator